MTKYTDEQLQAAMLQAGKYESVSISVDDSMHYVADYEIDDLRRILEALPDWRAGDAEVIEFEDIRVGDRILIKTVNGCFYEVTVKGIREDNAIWWAGSSVAQNMIARTYLMHRTVQHPDPAQHPVILIPRYNGVDKDPLLTPAAWDGRYYKTVNEPEYFSAKDITTWSPAKVIADE